MNLSEFQRKYGTDVFFATNGVIINNNTEWPQDWLYLHDLIAIYKREKILWFDGESANKSNPMSCITQEHWYSLYLEKLRLERRGLRTHHYMYAHDYQDVSKSIPKKISAIQNYYDGKYVVSSVCQDINYDVRYVRNNRMIGRRVKKCKIKHFVLRSKDKNGLYICPNCGFEQSLETLLDGCDYCNTKFDISAYNDKVISTNIIQKMSDGRDRNPEFYRWCALLFLAVMSLGIPTCFLSFFWPLFLVTIWIPLVFIGICIKKLVAISSKMKDSRMIEAEMRKHNPDMSYEEFFSSLDSKIKAIHFAAGPEDVEPFVKIDITPYLYANQDVISCETGNYWFKNYSCDQKYQYLNLFRSVRVLKDRGDRIEEAEGMLDITLAKRLKYRLKNDVTLFICNGCGASISLVEGGICQYCGNKMDYECYDWVIIGYKLDTHI